MIPGLAVEPASAKPADLVAVGENSVDFMCVTAERLAIDGKVRLQECRQLPGGQAATVAVGCARLGLRAEYVGAVGDDALAGVVERALVKEGVSLALVRRAGLPTRTAVVIVCTTDGTRSVLEYRHRGLCIGTGDVAADRFSRGRVLMVDGTDLPLSIRAARAARAANSRVVLDLDRFDDGADELMGLVDVPIVTERLVLKVSGAATVGEGLARLAVRYRHAAVVATLGREGALAWCGGREFRTAAAPVDAIDTTGAGDAFRAGFIAALLAPDRPPDMTRMLKWGAAAAALNCRAVGAQAALPTRAELEELV